MSVSPILDINRPVPVVEYCRVFFGTKRPVGKNWSTKTYTYIEILKWLKKGFGYGIVFGNEYAAVDIDTPGARDRFRRVFGCWPHEYPSVSWSSGKKFAGGWSPVADKETRISVLFKNSPEDQIVLTKRITGVSDKFDIRTGKNMSVLPSASPHPDTGHPYFWVNSPDKVEVSGWNGKLEELVGELLGEHSFSGDAYTDEHRLKVIEIRKSAIERFKQGDASFKHTPTSFMELVIEPYFQAMPEQLFDGGGIYHHHFRKITEHRYEGEPGWRASSTGRSLVITGRLNTDVPRPYLRWTWCDFGENLGGTALLYRHRLLGKTTRYPSKAEGWDICFYYANKLKNFGIEIHLPDYSRPLGININNSDFKYYEDPEDSTYEVIEDCSELLLSNEKLKEFIVEHRKNSDKPIEFIVPEGVSFKHFYKHLRLAGVRWIHNASDPGVGKTHEVAELTPKYFNSHQPETDLGGDEVRDIHTLVYLHPQFHLNPSVPGLAEWTRNPARHFGLSYGKGGWIVKHKDPTSEPDFEKPNCWRAPLFDRFHELGVPIPMAVNEHGQEINKICHTCPIQHDCKSGRGEYTYRHQKFLASKACRIRMSPESLPDATVNDAQERAFRFQNSVGIFDEIDQFDILKTFKLSQAHIAEAIRAFYKSLDEINRNRTKNNNLVRQELASNPNSASSELPLLQLPSALILWLHDLERICSPSVDKKYYGVGPDDPFLSDPLEYDREVYTEDYLKYVLSAIQSAIIDPNDFLFDENHDFGSVDFTENPIDKITMIATINGIELFDINLIFRIIRIKLGLEPGTMSLEASRKHFKPGSDVIGYDVVLTVPNKRLIDAISDTNGFNTSIFLDATANTYLLAKKLGIPANEIVRIKKVNSAMKMNPENLRIIQVTDFGRLGMSRGESLRERIRIGVEKIAELHPEEAANNQIGWIDFKKFLPEEAANDPLWGYWGLSSRGVNHYEKCKVLNIIGVLTPNLNAMVREFAQSFGYVPSSKVVPVERKINLANPEKYPNSIVTSRLFESEDLNFRKYCRARISQEIEQAIGRLRANRRLGENLTVYLWSDWPIDRPVELMRAHEIDRRCMPKPDFNKLNIAEYIIANENVPEKLKISKIQSELSLSAATIRRFLESAFLNNYPQFLTEIVDTKRLTNIIVSSGLVSISSKIGKNTIRNVEQTLNDINVHPDTYKIPEEPKLEISQLNETEPSLADLGYGEHQKVAPADARNLYWRTYENKNGVIEPHLNINEDNLDIFATAELHLPSFKPKDVPAFNTQKTVVCDIETVALPEYQNDPKAALDPNKSRVIYIGLRWILSGSTPYYHIISNESESVMLQSFAATLKLLAKNGLKVFALHNGHNFDLPYLIDKMNAAGIEHPFSISEYENAVPGTSLNGSAISIKEVYWIGEGTKYHPQISIIDTMLLLAKEDFVKRRLPNLKLKTGALAHGRSERRLELESQEIQAYWYSRDPDKLALIEQYLKYDLDDTSLLYNKLAPNFYYQQAFVPDASFQYLATGLGEGAKWNRIINYLIAENSGIDVVRCPRQVREIQPKPDTKHSFCGGITYGEAGVWGNVGKIDVSSMYPAIMIKYGIGSRKDEANFGLSVLNYLRKKRLELKRSSDPNDKEYANAMKPLINSCYGFLGTQGLAYNDYQAAGLVTAYGRALIKFMVNRVREFPGAQIVEVDTDGIIFALPENQDRDKNKAQFLEVFNYVCKSLPEGIEIDEIEFIAKGCYIPYNGAASPSEGTGQRKNYILIYDDGSKPTVKGLYRKRNRCELERSFVVDYLSKFINEGEAAANDFHRKIVAELQSGSYPIDKLTVTITVPKSDKKFSQILMLAPRGAKLHYWIGANGIETNRLSDGYSAAYYIQMINEICRGIHTAEQVRVYGKPQVPEQLNLFV